MKNYSLAYISSIILVAVSVLFFNLDAEFSIMEPFRIWLANHLILGIGLFVFASVIWLKLQPQKPDPLVELAEVESSANEWLDKAANRNSVFIFFALAVAFIIIAQFGFKDHISFPVLKGLSGSLATIGIGLLVWNGWLKRK